MMRKTILFLTVVTLASALLYAQEGKKSAEITGYLIDTRCATGVDEKDREHPVSCALMPTCIESGYTLVAKDARYRLDDKGNKRAVEILQNTKTKKRMEVKIEGTVKEGILYVDTMSEAR